MLRGYDRQLLDRIGPSYVSPGETLYLDLEADSSLPGIGLTFVESLEYTAKLEPLDAKHPEAGYVADLIVAVNPAIAPPEAGMGGPPR
jgi:hypothetical protein